MTESKLVMKLLKERYLECSICAMFFNSSLIVSIKARFLSRILSAYSLPFIFFRNFSCCNGSRSGYGGHSGRDTLEQ